MVHFIPFMSLSFILPGSPTEIIETWLPNYVSVRSDIVGLEISLKTIHVNPTGELNKR